MASIFETVAGLAIGYPEGTGGAVVTQETSKATGVTLNKPACVRSPLMTPSLLAPLK
jgi:hypothetical protein